MAGKIPNSFIDELIARTNIVDVIDRRVPLTRKGKEYMACCPFHDEKTPSFSVSPDKQFYHCFGCGAHGTAIGFLMEYANLSFREAVEELADSAGLTVPTTHVPDARPGERMEDLLDIVSRANRWFQDNLRNHPKAGHVVEYLESRGLDGRTAAAFGIGYAPDSWSGLVDALGTDSMRCRQLLKAGLINRRNKPAGSVGDYYDRFRNRVIFPIEDHRGRITGFGGRILGSGEPKYLNSPETPLFHKGAELYGLHRARRAIGAAGRSIIVEGYMDVVSLAQFGVDNAVATLGTATTRTHLQRLFRLSAEIVFCFDGDRAGRDAALKAMQVALPEMQDGRQAGFLFLPEGEDPDTIIRAEGKAGFAARIDSAKPFPDFVFDSQLEQVDMTRMDGKARLVSLVNPLIAQLPKGALQSMMSARLSSLTGLPQSLFASAADTAASSRFPRQATKKTRYGQISPVAMAISMLLQQPALGQQVNESGTLAALSVQGADVLRQLVARIQNAESLPSTARLLESFRDSRLHDYLQELAMRRNYIAESAMAQQFNDILRHLSLDQIAQHRSALLEKSKNEELSDQEKSELVDLLKQRSEDSTTR